MSENKEKIEVKTLMRKREPIYSTPKTPKCKRKLEFPENGQDVQQNKKPLSLYILDGEDLEDDQIEDLIYRVERKNEHWKKIELVQEEMNEMLVSLNLKEDELANLMKEFREI